MKSSTKNLLRLVSYCGLALSILPAVLVYRGVLSKETHFIVMNVGMLLWFCSAIWWIKPDHQM